MSTRVRAYSLRLLVAVISVAAVTHSVCVYAQGPYGTGGNPNPSGFLDPRYLGTEYVIVDQRGRTVFVKKLAGASKSHTNSRLPATTTQYNAFAEYPCDPCKNGTGRAKISGQITEIGGEIIQRRFALGKWSGENPAEFKLHVLTDPMNPNSPNNPLFWYENLDNPIGQDQRGKTIYERIFINEEHYSYLPEDHPIRVLSKLPPPRPRPVFWTLKGGGVAASSLGSGFVVGGLSSYGTTEALLSLGMPEESAQHYGAATGFSTGWLAGEGTAAWMTGGRLFTTTGMGGLAFSGPGAALGVHTHIMTSEICANTTLWAEALDRENAIPSSGRFMKWEFERRQREYEQAEERLWGYGLGSIWLGVKYWTGFGPPEGIGGGW